MYTQTLLVAALAGVFASAASAMPAEQGQGLAARSALIATTPCKSLVLVYFTFMVHD